MNNTIRVGQIGVGYWGPNLLRNLFFNNKCEVKKVVDLSEERRDFVKKNYPSVEVGRSADDLISDENIDAIIISTPVSTHYELSKKCLNANKHILVEKPMAQTSNEVAQIGEIATEKGLTAMVGHTFLFNEAVRYVRKLIDSGELGEIRYIYSQRLNLGRIRNDVDALWNLAPHDVSIIQYWLSNPSPISVTRCGQSYVQEGVDDVVFMNISYPNKILANIHVSWLDPHKVRSMTIVGTKKMVVYDDISDNKITIYDKGIDQMAVLGENMHFDNPKSLYFNYRSGDILIPDVKWKEPLSLEIDHFLDCIKFNKKCITGTDHAKKVVEILELGS